MCLLCFVLRFTCTHCTYKIYKDNLASLCKHYKIHLNHHDALSDSLACAELYLKHLKK